MDKLEIGKIIKLLRSEKQVTQEQLANYIGVSVAAVSKWESSKAYPDITSLPQLANFFGVSIDKLMNYKVDFSEDEINDIANECEALINENKIDESLALIEQYLKKYRTNYKLKARLASIYPIAIIKTLDDPKKQKKLIQKSINTLKDIVDNTLDIELKESSLILLTNTYIMNEQPDKAEETINKIYMPSCNPNIMLPLIYMQQDKIEEARKLLQGNLAKSLAEAIGSCMALSIAYYNYKDDIKDKDIDFCKAKKYIYLSDDIKKLLFDDKRKYSTNIGLFDIYVKNGELNKALESLEKMMNCARNINLNIYKPLNINWCYDKLDNPTVSMNVDIYDSIISVLKNSENLFKENEKYKAIIDELQELQEKNKL